MMWQALFESILEVGSMNTGPIYSGNKRRSKWGGMALVGSLFCLVAVINFAPECFRAQHLGWLITLVAFIALLLSSTTLALMILLRIIKSIYPKNFLLLFTTLAIIYSLILFGVNLKFEFIS